jgi:hypothetical protein
VQTTVVIGNHAITFSHGLNPWRSFAELGRNVNERLEAVVRDAAVIGDRRTVAAIRTDGVGAATPAP